MLNMADLEKMSIIYLKMLFLYWTFGVYDQMVLNCFLYGIPIMQDLNEF